MNSSARYKLGEILIRLGVLTDDKLAKALEMQSQQDPPRMTVGKDLIQSVRRYRLPRCWHPHLQGALHVNDPALGQHL